MNQFPQITIKHAIGNILEIPNQIASRASTYFAADLSVGSTTVLAQNAFDFTSGSILQLSSMGSENCEIVVSSANTNFQFTVSATKTAHTRGDIIKEISFNQVEVHKSSTLAGTYSLLSTNNFQMTQMNTIVNDTTGTTSDFYKLRWKNSDTEEVSSFSSPISVLTYPENSVAETIFPVLLSMGISSNDQKINTKFLLSAVNDARKFAKAKMYGFRHAWNQKFEHPLKVLAGNNFVNLPEDIDFDTTDRSLLSARFIFGAVMSPYNLTYIDKRSWNQRSYQLSGSTNSSVVAASATTIDLVNSGDFEPIDGSGVAYVATDSFDQEIMAIGYTGVDLVNNQLTGVTGVTREIPLGTKIWSNPTIGQPVFYTVYDGKIVFERVLSDAMQGNNLYIDYYQKLEKVTDYYQVLRENYREIYTFYLRYAIKYRRDNTTPTSDPDLVKFNELLEALFDNLYTGQPTTIIT